MGDRWNPTIRTVTTVKPFKFFVPGEPGDSAAEIERPAGRSWTTRRRGDLEGAVKHSYRCHVHGPFDVMVPRSGVPDEVACPVCGRPSTWAGSSCGIGHAAGEVES